MGDPRTCPQCGADLRNEALDGLCQDCLGKLALGSEGQRLKAKGQSADGIAAVGEVGRDVPIAPLSAIEHPVSSIEHPATRFGDYELLAEIAHGGMGVVYKARQVSLNRTVAVKMIRAGPFASKEFVHRFRVEASAAAVLQHPNIVAVHEVGVHEGQHFFSMDYVAGQNLAQIVRDGPLPPNHAARYVQKIAEAIHYAHQSGILHRDLKPSNVLIDQNDQPRITDFGLAKQLNVESSATLTGDVMGTPGYMPPEQASGNRGAVKAWSDVYSLGAILYHLLTGRAPFAAGSLEETLNQVLHQDPVSIRLLNPAVPRDLDTICLKCLEKEPVKRYGSAQLLAEELGRFLNHEPILARPISTAGKAWRWCRRKPALAGTGAFALLAVVLGFVGVFWQWRNSEGHRHLAERNANQAQATVTRLEINRAEMLFASDQSGEALAYLARVLRREPTNRMAAERIISSLARRNFCVPLFRLEHKDAIVSAEFSPDGQRIVTASKDGTARLWDGRSGQPLFGPLQHNGEVTAARFSPDGQRVATASLDKTARIWDANTAQGLIEPLRHEDGVLCADFSPDGQRLVTGSADGSMRVWNAATGRPIQQLVPLIGAIHFVKFSPDGRRIVLSSEEAYGGRLLDATDGKELANFVQAVALGALGSRTPFPSFSADSRRVLTVRERVNLNVIWTDVPVTNRVRRGMHTINITSARFSPDGQYLATSAMDSTARLWDAGTVQPLGEAMRHGNYVNSIEFSPDGSQVVTGSRDHTARIWDSRTGLPLSEPLRHGANVLSAQFSSDGQRILSLCEGTAVCVWEVRSAQHLAASFQHPSEVRRAVFSPNGERLATIGNGLRLWDAQRARAVLARFGVGSGDQDLQFSSDGRLLLSVGSPPSGGHTATVSIYDPTTGRMVAGPFRSPTPAHETQCGRFSPDGELVLLGGYGHKVRIWRIATGSLVAELAHDAPAGYAQFSPDGQWVISTSADKTARLWDWRSARPLMEPLRHGGAVVWADVSADSRRVVTISRDQTARIWDARSGKLLHMLWHAEEPYHFNTVQFSSDGRWVVTGAGNAAQVWDARTGLPVTAPLKHEGRVNSVRFSPDGQRLVTACNDFYGRIWDAATGHLLSEPLPHRARVIYAEFSPDGRSVVTASTDGTARIWEVPTMSSSMPPWLSDWAEAVGGQRVDGRGAAQSVPFEERSHWRERLARMADGDETARWAKWFFVENSRRTVSPTSPITVPQWVERCIGENSLQNLEQAVRLAPTNGLAQARLALVRRTNEANASPRLMSECEWQSRRALELSPDNPEVWWARAQLLEHAGKLTEALEAMDRAGRLNSTNAAFWNARGLMLEKTNRWEQALQAYTQAAQLSGPWQDTLSYPAIALLNRSKLLWRMNRVAEATADNLAAANVPARDPKAPGALIDLSLFYTTGLDYEFGRIQGNNYLSAGSIPGRQTLDDTEFDARGFIALQSPGAPPRSAIVPESVSGIPVNQRCRRLHFLHAVTSGVIPEGTQVGAYVIHYADSQTEEIPINYGEHLRFIDGDNDSGAALASHSALVWTGTNAAKSPFRLFRTTWTNRHPEVVVKTIDFASALTQGQPLLFAITAEP